jgi:hypothetical protein
MITRLTLLAACVTTLAGVVAGQAQAAPTPPTISPATAITPESAMLHGQIATGGTADEYSFEYDTLSDWNAGGDNASFTSDVPIPAGNPATLNVSAEAGCYPALTCTDQLPLIPHTKYVFLLSVQYNISGAYYSVATVQTTTETFTTTKLGRLQLLSRIVTVKKGIASIEMGCTSAVPCRGAVSVTTRHKGKKISCLAGNFSVRAGHKGTVHEQLNGVCRVLLAKSSSHTWTGTLSAVTTTDQPGVRRKPVVLSGTAGKK